jgi:hypothetical protein
MAARTRKTTLNEKWREKIQASMLVNRLTAHALGEVELSNSQIRAIEILLKKVAPDLAAIQHSGDEANPLYYTKVERFVIDNAAN